MLNHPSLQNKTNDVVIHQHSRKLLKMDILMSETCWAHKKWNKIASDIKLVFYSSTITMTHGPINIRYILLVKRNHNDSTGGRDEKKTHSSNDLYVFTIPVARLIAFPLYDVIPKTKRRRDVIPKHDVSFMTWKHCEWLSVQLNNLCTRPGKLKCPGVGFSIHWNSVKVKEKNERLLFRFSSLSVVPTEFNFWSF